MLYKLAVTRIDEARRNKLAMLYAIGSKGQYLHMMGAEFTSDAFYAWRGSPAQFSAMSKIWSKKGVKLKRVHVGDSELA